MTEFKQDCLSIFFTMGGYSVKLIGLSSGMRFKSRRQRWRISASEGLLLLRKIRTWGVCTCARAVAPRVWPVCYLSMAKIYVHAKFEQNRPNRSRVIASQTHGGCTCARALAPRVWPMCYFRLTYIYPHAKFKRIRPNRSGVVAMQIQGVSRAHVGWYPRMLYVCYFTRVDIFYPYAKLDQNRPNRSRVIAG